MTDIEKLIKHYLPRYFKDLSALVAIPSIRSRENLKLNAPFGLQIRNVMDKFMEIALNLGYRVVDVDGYVIYAQLGESEEHLGILGHLDVVEAGELEDWDTNPFNLVQDGDFLFGRGVNDDKGPLLAALYAGAIAYKINPNISKSIRIIAGGAEETTWECMNYYFSKYEQPMYGFSPDGDFPVVNGEKGILQVELTFRKKSLANLSSYPEENFVCEKFIIDDKIFYGDKSLSRNPHRGINAIDIFFNKHFSKYEKEDWYQFIKKHLNNQLFGSGLEIKREHLEMGKLTLCMMSLKTDKEQNVKLALDFRYPINILEKEILHTLYHYGMIYNFDIKILKNLDPLFVNLDNELVQRLLDSYEAVIGERPIPITKGGASYARTMNNCVSFGATFEWDDPRPHMSNENMKISSIVMAIKIYINAIINLMR